MTTLSPFCSAVAFSPSPPSSFASDDLHRGAPSSRTFFQSSPPPPTASRHESLPQPGLAIQSCFYPTTEQALAAASAAAAANTRPIMEDARLPPAVMSFYKPSPPDGIGAIHFASIGGSGSKDMISMDQDGNTLLFDAAARAIRVMPMPHVPKYSPISVTVGDGLYLLDKNPNVLLEGQPFEVLVHLPRARPIHSFDDDVDMWHWRSLPPPPYADEYYECRKVGDIEEYNRRCYEWNGKDPYLIGAYTVVGDTQIWISTKGGGTFSFDTASGVWSEAGDWALPFDGCVEYAPELGLWAGGSLSVTLGPATGAAGNLARARFTSADCHSTGSQLSTSSFLLALEGWCPQKDCDFLPVETFVVFTGVEIERGSLKMIRHKSRRYSLGPSLGELLNSLRAFGTRSARPISSSSILRSDPPSRRRHHPCCRCRHHTNPLASSALPPPTGEDSFLAAAPETPIASPLRCRPAAARAQYPLCVGASAGYLTWWLGLAVPLSTFVSREPAPGARPRLYLSPVLSRRASSCYRRTAAAVRAPHQTLALFGPPFPQIWPL
ncbi:hypothetical protein HU200_017133 [Digitaria exilis]|uniref:Uncharacterized protein n=1 Tax=Digitaria exilis TaxID=1010633 RepID=A0A835F7C3_9POAL|nr:hypothetical protein HU200_017133 [Digitaria exilis]